MIWSFVLAAVGIAGLWAAGRRLWWGWAIGLGAQVLWACYAVFTGQLGFLVSAAAYAVVYGRNASRWRREQEAAEQRARAEP